MEFTYTLQQKFIKSNEKKFMADGLRGKHFPENYACAILQLLQLLMQLHACFVLTTDIYF